MINYVVSNSPSFSTHVSAILGHGSSCTILSSGQELADAAINQNNGAQIAIVHLHSTAQIWNDGLQSLIDRGVLRVAVASDKPNLVELLDLAEKQISAYFNSYMADLHYRHMLSALAMGDKWFAPNLVQHAIDLARRTKVPIDCSSMLERLSQREREIALDVAAGYDNRVIAMRRAITERTVKSHLTNIFKKLNISNRLALATSLQQSTH